MAVIGSLGDMPFFVNNKQVKTFNGMRWDSSVRFATHNRHMKDALVEFVGINADTISFTMNLSVFLGVDPMTEIMKLFETERRGEALVLVLGSRIIGRRQWVITRTQKQLERFDNNGNLLAARVTVTLMSYSRR
ncbi:MAG: phage tail protein [Oscillospiraceae bacterium]|jgi:phage protein U|nr:phage tail protein [Oscillospiraceae bacterium]